MICWIWSWVCHFFISMVHVWTGNQFLVHICVLLYLWFLWLLYMHVGMYVCVYCYIMFVIIFLECDWRHVYVYTLVYLYVCVYIYNVCILHDFSCNGWVACMYVCMYVCIFFVVRWFVTSLVVRMYVCSCNNVIFDVPSNRRVDFHNIDYYFINTIIYKEYGILIYDDYCFININIFTYSVLFFTFVICRYMHT
jgi:hypothetical protein